MPVAATWLRTAPTHVKPAFAATRCDAWLLWLIGARPWRLRVPRGTRWWRARGRWSPRVGTGFDHIRIARLEFGLRAILAPDAQSPFVNDTHVSRLAAFGSRDGLHALRPTPTRLEGEASRGRSGHPDDFYASLLRGAR